MRIEPPSAGRIERLVGSAMRTHDQRFCEAIFAKLSGESLRQMDELLATYDEDDPPEPDDRRQGRSSLGWLKADPGAVNLESVMDEIEKLRRVRGIGLLLDLFVRVSPKILSALRTSP
jgi:hypothetical protein